MLLSEMRTFIINVYWFTLYRGPNLSAKTKYISPSSAFPGVLRGSFISTEVMVTGIM